MKEFLDLIDKFKLLNYYKKDYNIIISGDLNFKIVKKNYITPNL